MTAHSYLPAEFVARIKDQLGPQTVDFLSALAGETIASVLLNPLKKGEQPFSSEEDVPWAYDGKFLDRRPEFVFDPIFHAGGYYVMEAASMLLAEALRTLALPSDDPLILDLCGAPGGKSMVTLNYLNGRGLLISNEVNRKRFGVLNENINKWGHGNTITSNLDPSRVPLDGVCDCVIVDAPCSGEGLFRKTPKSIKEWTPVNAGHCSLRQRRILGEAIRMVRPGGYLIYSTCTYNPAENIQNVAWLARLADAQTIGLQNTHGTEAVEQDGFVGYQCWPHIMKGEGFFLAILHKRESKSPLSLVKGKIRKADLLKLNSRDSDPWRGFVDMDRMAVFGDSRGSIYAFPEGKAETMLEISSLLPGSKPGTYIGTVKGSDVVPSHQLALSTFLRKDFPAVSLGPEPAISYLRRDSLVPLQLDRGWYIATHRGYNLGWIKQAGNLTKNYFPIDLRIRKMVD